MNSEIQKLLEVLGFPKGSKRLPKIKEVRKQFLKLSLIRHPDKATGNNKDMTILIDAYEQVGKIIENMENIIIIIIMYSNSVQRQQT